MYHIKVSWSHCHEQYILLLIITEQQNKYTILQIFLYIIFFTKDNILPVVYKDWKFLRTLLRASQRWLRILFFRDQKDGTRGSLNYRPYTGKLSVRISFNQISLLRHEQWARNSLWSDWKRKLQNFFIGNAVLWILETCDTIFSTDAILFSFSQFRSFVSGS